MTPMRSRGLLKASYGVMPSVDGVCSCTMSLLAAKLVISRRDCARSAAQETRCAVGIVKFAVKGFALVDHG